MSDQSRSRDSHVSTGGPQSGNTPTYQIDCHELGACQNLIDRYPEAPANDSDEAFKISTQKWIALLDLPWCDVDSEQSLEDWADNLADRVQTHRPRRHYQNSGPDELLTARQNCTQRKLLTGSVILWEVLMILMVLRRLEGEHLTPVLIICRIIRRLICRPQRMHPDTLIA
eukprot:GHVN01020351.1.p1 GENE.GHVN01020351.1~~GHVN01020351.1.p1  ORF type:complete len:171 (+),score=18.63 GHVN01020351.1:238-750(+)